MWSRRFAAGLFASALATGAISLTGVAAASAAPSAASDAPKPAADTLGSHDSELLAQAEAKGEPTVTLIVATDKGKTKNVAGELKKLGGKVAKQVDQVGYVRVQVPTANVRKAAKVPGVSAVDLNESIPLPKPEPVAKAEGGASAQAAVAAPGKDTPATNPYMPTNETGAVAFKQAHSTWDGRGVTIGIMDSGVDLDNPALQTTSTGERKIVDWFTATDPIYDNDGTWLAMLTTATGPTVTYKSESWTVPAGTYKISRFSEAIAVGEVGGDVNRDGDTTDTFGVLYDPANGDIRVDVNQNHDFTDDPVMRPYKERFDVGHFGTDNPATPVREQMPFVVEHRSVDTTAAGVPGLTDFVNIGIVEGAHGSHVAGITAGYDMFGNPNYNGAAPGAKIVSARACSWGGGCTAAALMDGMADLVINHHVDVVNMSIGGLPGLNDGSNARAELYNRLINDYGVQMFISAGNSGPGVNTVGDPSVASNVVSVAASVSKDTWLANYGSVVRTKESLFNFSSRGPREDGGFKPEIAAPGSAISTVPMWQPGQPVADAGYALPAGYAMFNGTSMAAPQATGAAALLLSAAKATDKGVTPAALRRAIFSSARPIDGVQAYEQGYGEFNVPGAWNLLKGGVETRGYTADAPVCTPLSAYLTTPNRGVGVYNRCAVGSGGQKAGQDKTYRIKVTRTSGPKGDVKHVLRWVGNDGTFKSDRNVDLPLNKPVTVEVEAKAGVGVHSAILEIDDPKTSVVDFEVLNTVVIANDTTAKAPAYSFTTQGSVDRNAYKTFFVTVPEGATALQVNLSGIATGAQTRFIAFNPWGVPVEDTSSLGCYTNFSDPAVCKPQERDYQNPMPGIWEFEVEARRTSPALNNPFSLTARVQGVTVNPAVVQLPSVPAGQPSAVSWTVKNTFGPVKVSGQGGPLGSAATARPTIKPGESQTYTVVVPAGATKLDVKIGNPSDPGADLDLYVRRNGAVVGQSADGDSEEEVVLTNPAPGTYQVQVVGYAAPTGSTQYDYRDVFYSPSLGSVSVPNTAVSLANGASAAIAGTVTAQQAPTAGRQLFGEMTVVTDEGAVVGRGNVQIGAVS
ncbi:S8 family serine peptidase [Planosporangium thailandense]|uniref:S8 family serine peptidase n=1 Tax=Planosporangium thailandense TaxID=765197 RepID=A0ABX0Y741_9ACTN|nr:S8 family serine peptidase [Planosporangium thailandense]NJC74241.1 S8 family serine peptidase [Planosporangium thailandense]